MGKKKIDELFQEKFQDFHETPSESVWQRLEASLDKKENSRKVVPFRWKLGGVAAVVLIGLWLANPFSSNGIETEDPKVTNTEQQQNRNENLENGTSKSSENTTNNADSGIADTEGSSSEASENLITEGSEGVIANKASSKSLRATGKEKLPNQQETAVSNNNSSPLTVTQPTTRQRQQIANPSMEVPLGKPSQDAVVAENTHETNTIEDVTPPTKTNSDGIAESNPAGQHPAEENAEVSPLYLDPVGQEKEAIAAIDSAAVQKKSIFDEIKPEGEEQEAVVEGNRGRWSAGPSIAPVFYSSFGEGSPVHSIFVPNSKSGETNLSYGLSIAYELNDRLSVRSGIHKVDFGYGTDDIAFSTSVQGSENGQIDNIDYALNSRSLVVQSKAGPSTQGVNNEALQPLDVSAPQATRDGTMAQEFGYLEVPLELNYALIDKKFGVNIIGGVSSLFLVDNSVSLTSGNQTLEMGEANNVNGINFSTNVGFGLDYNFSEKVKLNIEPVFKYQLNAFSDIDGTFRPFSVGVYSGLSFRF